MAIKGYLPHALHKAMKHVTCVLRFHVRCYKFYFTTVHITHHSLSPNRQSSDCLSDTTEYEHDYTLRECIQISEEIEDEDVLSEDTINDYCSLDCGNVLMDFLHKFEKDCHYDFNVSTSYPKAQTNTVKNG